MERAPRDSEERSAVGTEGPHNNRVTTLVYPARQSPPEPAGKAGGAGAPSGHRASAALRQGAN